MENLLSSSGGGGDSSNNNNNEISASLGDVSCNLVDILFPFHVFLLVRLGHRSFICLLCLVFSRRTNVETVSVFLQLSSVPCWQFIGWISQMMALLDKDEAVAVQHTVEEIANTYPQAIIYPFMISSESYCFKDTATGCKNREFVER